MTSAAEQYAAERWDPEYRGDRAYMRIAIQAFNAALEHAAKVAADYAREAEHQRDHETDYPESRQGAQVHGYMHGALDVEIRIRRVLRGEAAIRKGQTDAE